MWSQIISSSSLLPKMAILPNDDYCLMTIFLPCPKVVIISNTHCTGLGQSENPTLVLWSKYLCAPRPSASRLGIVSIRGAR